MYTTLPSHIELKVEKPSPKGKAETTLHVADCRQKLKIDGLRHSCHCQRGANTAAAVCDA